LDGERDATPPCGLRAVTVTGCPGPDRGLSGEAVKIEDRREETSKRGDRAVVVTVYADSLMIIGGRPDGFMLCCTLEFMI